jgi:hypothetical protein
MAFKFRLEHEDGTPRQLDGVQDGPVRLDR